MIVLIQSLEKDASFFYSFLTGSASKITASTRSPRTVWSPVNWVEKPQALDVCGQRQWCRCFKSRPNANVAKSLTWAKTFQSLLFTGSSDSNVTFERYDRATLRMMAGGDAFASVKWRYTQVVVCLLLHEDWFIMIRAWWEGPSVDTAPAIYYSIALLLRRFC